MPQRYNPFLSSTVNCVFCCSVSTITDDLKSVARVIVILLAAAIVALRTGVVSRRAVVAAAEANDLDDDDGRVVVVGASPHRRPRPQRSGVELRLLGDGAGPAHRCWPALAR